MSFTWRLPDLLAALFLAAVTPLFVPATPSPAAAASALPEIGRVRSNAMCTTLKQNIAPTILGLMRNDELIGAGHRAFLKMSSDAGSTSSAVLEFDDYYLEQLETRLVHNLGLVDKLLGDEARFPKEPKTDDERDANAMRDQLLAVTQAQKKALDLVSGTIATESLGRMQGELDNNMKGAISNNTTPVTQPTNAPVSFIGSAGLPDYQPQAGLPTIADKTSSLGGHTVYDQIAAALEGTQQTTARREQVATSAVLTAVDECRASIAPQPSPSPTP